MNKKIVLTVVFCLAWVLAVFYSPLWWNWAFEPIERYYESRGDKVPEVVYLPTVYAVMIMLVVWGVACFRAVYEVFEKRSE
jgi:hypothetical protein